MAGREIEIAHELSDFPVEESIAGTRQLAPVMRISCGSKCRVSNAQDPADEHPAAVMTGLVERRQHEADFLKEKTAVGSSEVRPRFSR